MMEKGQDISILPAIPKSNYLPQVDLLNERDVEIQLIEPLLQRLGYGNSDWIKQMPLKMGSGERYYPDYAIGANVKRGEESAKFLIESKFKLSSQKDFKDAFFQAKSYALRLQSKVFALASIEGICIFGLERGSFSIHQFIQKTWGELNHPDEFYKILQLIGKTAVWKIKNAY